MKKIKFYLALIAILSLGLIGCENAQLNSNKVNKLNNGEVAALNTDQNVMLFSTLSSASVLSSESSTVSSLSNVGAYFGGENKDVEIDMEKANSYLLMMENILADGGPIVSSEMASDREGYEMMMVITVKDLAGNVSAYTIYYSILVDGEVIVPEVNSNSSSEEVVKEPAYRKGWDDDDHDDDDDDDRYDDDKRKDHEKAWNQFKHHDYDEQEISYDINALAVFNGVEYKVIGKKEVETEDNETEVEMEFIVKLDEGNYVRIEQETENDEIEYKYVVYQNGKKQLSMSFESEVENGATVIKLTTDEKGYKETYKFIKGDNKTIIKYSGNGYSYTLYVTSKLDEVTGELVYEYKEYEKEFKWEYRRGHKHNRD